jgi:hypothetical protein
MKTEETKLKKISLKREIAGTIFEGILNVNEKDIKLIEAELESQNTIRQSEIYIGKMDEREIRVVAYIFKAKKCLIDVMGEIEGPLTNEGNDWSLPNKLSKDIKFAKSWLNYLITSRLNIPNNCSLTFKKDFQIIAKHEESFFFDRIHGEEDE